MNAGEIMAREVICVGLGGVPGVRDVQAHLGRLLEAEAPLFAVVPAATQQKKFHLPHELYSDQFVN